MSLPAGIRNYNYATDMAIFRTKTQWVMLIVFLVLVFTFPLYLDNYWLHIANLIGITIIAATGLNILVGYCGQLSIGHAGFIAVGAYTSAILTSKMGVPFPVAFICSGITAGLVGIIFGMPSLRVKGFYLAISTIAAQFIIIWILQNWTSMTGGYNGLNVPAASIGGFVFKTESSQFYLIMVIVAITLFFAKNLSRTRPGRAFVAVRDNDLTAQVIGINLFRYKLLAFFIGCFFAGIAGSLFAHFNRTVNFEQFPLTDSILYIGMIIIGGLCTTIVPIRGVVFIRLIDILVTQLSPSLQTAFPWIPSNFTSGIAPMIFGLAIILFIIFEPRGIAHRWSKVKTSYRLWPFSY